MTTCETCGKEFTRAAALEKHKGNKRPCKAPTQLIQQALLGAGVEVGEFRTASKNFNATTTKEDRAKEGIFFTPKKARDLLMAKVAETGIQPTVILEPSFGSGEFIHDARAAYPEAHILGVEKNETLFKAVKCLDSRLSCTDFLRWTGRANLIIGNPPYFLMEGEKKQYDCMTGRPNIYVLFLYKCLEEHLEPGGVLAFILPTSMYNCSYYQPMRDYIKENTTIRYLETLNKPGFYETGQETMLIVLEKRKGADDYIFRPKSGYTYITPFYKELYEVTRDTTTLRELGLGVKTGNVVWNQEKEKLADEGTLLIYSSNINNCELKLNNLLGSNKKQYVKGITKPTLDGPVILVERGYGNSFSFNSVLVTLKGFYAENHLNVIYAKTAGSEGNLEKVMESFKDERSLQFIRWFLGNGSMTSTDLETTMPIFLDTVIVENGASTSV